MRLKLTYQIITTISIVSQEKNNSDIKTGQTIILEKSILPVTRNRSTYKTCTGIYSSIYSFYEIEHL